MKDFADNLYDQLQESLREISGEQDKHPLRRARDSVVAVRSTIMELKRFILSYSFADQAEEILFFKEIQPEFYSLLIYYIRMVFIETHQPVGSKDDRRLFLEKELHHILTFFEQNQEIYRYYRLEETVRDPQYFLRDPPLKHLMTSDLPTEDAYLLYDSRFCTEMGYKISRIKANELLRPYLEEKLEEIETGRQRVHNPLTWKLKKVHLAELIFLLHAYGAFGNLKPKTIVDAIASMWNCPLSNIYKTFEEMRIRKKERFPFTRQMLSAGERQMDEDDLKAR